VSAFDLRYLGPKRLEKKESVSKFNTLLPLLQTSSILTLILLCYSGTYYMNHLRFIKLNDHFVPFTSLNLTYLLKVCFQIHYSFIFCNSNKSC